MDQANQWIIDTVETESLRRSREILKSAVAELFDRLMDAGYDSMEACAYIEGIVASDAVPTTLVPLVVLWIDRLMEGGTCDEITDET